jgi:hypothetical protein
MIMKNTHRAVIDEILAIHVAEERQPASTQTVTGGWL